MNQLQKYTWLIETIRRAGKISHKDLSDKWERCKDLSDCKPLHRAHLTAGATLYLNSSAL